ncbi:MAG TPA: MFS transporter [Acidimicrobiales bacterium]|nr:MFS transporter [Acidimicrobiales bacterium]
MDAKERTARLRECPGFVRYWMASTVSDFGTYISTIAIQVIVVFVLHKGAVGVGLVSAARWLPYPLFGLVAGVLVDRSRRRPLLVITDLVRGLLFVVVPVLALIHHLSLVILMLFMAAFGLMSLLNDAASQSFLPRLVPANQLVPANARLDQSGAVAQTSGPAIGGGLVSLLTAPWAVLIDAASYVASGLLLLRMPVSEPPRRSVSLRGVRREALEGIRWIYQHAALRPLALSTHGWFLCNAVAGTVLPLFVLQTLGMSAFGYGVALSVGGVGALVGSLAATRLGARFGCGRVVVACRVATAAAWAFMAFGQHHLSGWVVLGAGQFLLGLSMGAENANEMGYWQAVTPDALQGRMNATRRSINRAMIVIGAPTGGLLGDTIGYRPMLWIVAGGFFVVAISLGLSQFRDARVDDAHT